MWATQGETKDLIRDAMPAPSRQVDQQHTAVEVAGHVCPPDISADLVGHPWVKGVCDCSDQVSVEVNVPEWLQTGGDQDISVDIQNAIEIWKQTRQQHSKPCAQREPRGPGERLDSA